MELSVLQQLNEARRNRRAGLVITPLDGDAGRFVSEGEVVDGELGEAVQKAFLTGKSTKVETGGKELFLNVHVPAPRLVVIGAVHISQALVPLARLAGYGLQVIDPRTAFATPERFEGVDLHADWPEEVLANHPLDAYTALAAVTHDPKIDDFPLGAALETGCFYVGALGSRKTHGKRLDRLEAAGVSRDKLATIKAPIGLDIGASSPPEIAIAIMAEIIEAFRRRGLDGEKA